MPVYLDEQMVGEDTSEVNFPGLILCAGVVVQMSNGRLIGVHITDGSSEKEMLAELKRRMTAAQGIARNLYIVTNLDVHKAHKGMTPLQMAQELKISMTSNVCYYDTLKLKPTEKGIFARLTYDAKTAQCGVILANEESMTGTYVRGAVPGGLNNVRKYSTEKGWHVPSGSFHKVGINGPVMQIGGTATFQSIN